MKYRTSTVPISHIFAHNFWLFTRNIPTPTQKTTTTPTKTDIGSVLGRFLWRWHGFVFQLENRMNKISKASAQANKRQHTISLLWTGLLSNEIHKSSARLSYEEQWRAARERELKTKTSRDERDWIDAECKVFLLKLCFLWKNAYLRIRRSCIIKVRRTGQYSRNGQCRQLRKGPNEQGKLRMKCYKSWKRWCIFKA